MDAALFKKKRIITKEVMDSIDDAVFHADIGVLKELEQKYRHLYTCMYVDDDRVGLPLLFLMYLPELIYRVQEEGMGYDDLLIADGLSKSLKDEIVCHIKEDYISS